MIEPYQNDLKWAESNKKRLRGLPSRVSKSRDFDRNVHELHVEVFDEIDCLKCANCCKTAGPLLQSADIARLSKRLKIQEKVFVDRYLKIDEEGDFVFQSMPCPFLLEDNACSVYEDRPKACRAYPHTDQKGQLDIFDLTRKNARICPAVSRILRRLSDQV